MSLPAALQPDSDSEDELPHGWEERTDEDGKVFFVKCVYDAIERRLNDSYYLYTTF